MIQEHKQRVAELTKAIEEEEQAPISATDILRLQDELLNLKHTGHTFRQILEASQALREKFKRKEKIININGVKSVFAKWAGNKIKSIFR